jgi:hypothetical protein
VANSLLHSLILKTFITVVEMREKRAFSGPAESLNSACMSIACSFFGGSSGNPACATWWITRPKESSPDKNHVIGFREGVVEVAG